MLDDQLLKVPKKSQEIIEASVDDTVILLSIERSEFYGIKDSAMSIWEKIDGDRSILEIRDAVTDGFDADIDAMTLDIVGFIMELEEKGLIRF